MVALSTTQLSSKGQVVIPEEIRDRLGLKPGSRFIVVAERGVVIFKVIDAPDRAEFDPLIAKARRSARRVRLSGPAVAASIRRVRGRR